MKYRKTIGIALAALVLLAALTITGIALRRNSGGEGRFERDIIDRVRFTASPTSLTMTDAVPGEETELTFTLTAQKTEADFYAMIHSIRIEGLEYASVRFQSDNAGDAYVPENLLLPAENTGPTEVTWTVMILYTPDSAGSTEFAVEIDYSAGLTQETADEHILSIPMQVTVTE